MNTSLIRTISRLLIVCMLAMPFSARAGLIGTDAVAAAQLDAGQNAVNRAELSSQLQKLGVDAATAKDRVAALTDTEAAQLSTRIHSLPAGANGTGLLVLILLGVLIWWAVKR